MKFRITPLNLVSSLGLLLLALSYFSEIPVGFKINLSALLRIVLACLVLVSVVTDLIFRALFKSLKRIWLVELVFISLTVIIFLLLRLVS